MKKPQKPCGVWGFVTCIYFGHIMWLHRWDIGTESVCKHIPPQSHSRLLSPAHARLGTLLALWGIAAQAAPLRAKKRTPHEGVFSFLVAEVGCCPAFGT